MAGKQVSSNQRFLGVDLGAETLKLVELARVDGQWLVACVPVTLSEHSGDAGVSRQPRVLGFGGAA